MNKILYPLLVVLLVLISACNTGSKDFENVVEITPEDTKNWGLPEVSFKFSYPTDENISVLMAQNGQYNLSYAFVDYIEDKLSNEEISFGYCNSCSINSEETIESLLNELAAQFEYQLSDFNVESNGIEKFDGENRNILKFSFSVKDESLGFVPGNYIAMMVVYVSKKYKNGVLMVLIANKDKTAIKSFSDFGKKGNLAKIIHTFRFAE